MSSSFYLTIVILCTFVAAVIIGRSTRGHSSNRHQKYLKKAEAIYRDFQRPGYNDAQKLSFLRKINPYVFEELILIAFHHKGIEIKRNQRYSGDGGIDGRLVIEGKDYYIQCKRYRSHIHLDDVMAFARLCDRKRVGGYFVHTGRTGQAVWKIAEEFENIKIISGGKLIRLLSEKND